MDRSTHNRSLRERNTHMPRAYPVAVPEQPRRNDGAMFARSRRAEGY
jgi:hypothetical protein